MILSAIRLNPQLYQAHHRILLGYLTDELALSSSDWATLAETVDRLGASVLVVDGQERTFRQFYEEYIDKPFADPFLSVLLTLADVEREGRRVQAATAQEICLLLDGAEGFSRHDSNCRILLVYCLYWWAAFARGYIFEVTIFRDLTAFGVQFIAHDITNRYERLAPYDLLLLDLRGDIKHTTYFLTAEWLSQLVSDFFITRWYLPHHRAWLRVAILRELAWRVLSLSQDNGSRQSVTLDDIARLLPQVATFAIDRTTLTAMGYDLWKQRVLSIQATRGE